MIAPLEKIFSAQGTVMYVCLSVCLHPISNLSCVCLSVYLSVCYQKCYWVTNLNISAKWSQIFLKLLVYFRIGLLSWLKIFMCMHVHTCTQKVWKCAWNFLHPLIFNHFVAFPDCELKWDALFLFYAFFLFQSGSAHKNGRNRTKMVKISLFWPIYAS